MPKGRPKKNTPQIPPEGWGRCADCMSKNYETWCYHLNMETSKTKRARIESTMMACEDEFDIACRREKAGTTYDPKEHTCICCTYEKEYKKDIESGKLPVVTTKTEFKKLCKEYMKTYKKVERIPITSRKTKNKIDTPTDEEEDEI